MAKMPFTLEAWLKDKSQRVETRDGRIVHNIWRVKEPTYTNNRKAEVCALIDGEEDALVFFEGGRYLPTTRDTDSPFDLFIVTPGLELTEFEKTIKDLVLAIDEGELQKLGVFEEENLGAWAVKKAAKLLELARKQLTCQGNIVLSIEGFEKCFIEAQEKGRKEALKDLPRWRTWKKGACGNGEGVPMAIVKKYCGGYILADVLCSDMQYILLSDLEKLPKEDLC